MSGAPYGRVSPGLTAAADGGSPASQRHGGISTATFRADRHRRSPCDPSHKATHGRPDPATPRHANLCDLVLCDLVLRGRDKRHRRPRTEDAKDKGLMIDAEQELSIERAVFRGIIVWRPRRILARIQRMHRNT